MIEHGDRGGGGGGGGDGTPHSERPREEQTPLLFQKKSSCLQRSRRRGSGTSEDQGVWRPVRSQETSDNNTVERGGG